MRWGAVATVALSLTACGRFGFDRGGDRDGGDDDGGGGDDVPSGPFVATFETAIPVSSPAELTFPLTVGAGANRALAVFTHIGTRCAMQQPTVATVTYNGVALARIRSETNLLCPGMSSDLWALPPGTQPASGTHDVVVTLTANLTILGSIDAGAISAQDVDQTATFTSTASAHGQSTLAAVTLPASGATDLVIHSACNGLYVSSTPQALRWLDNAGNLNSCNNNGGATAPGGTTNLSWAVTADFWTMIGASFKAVGAATATFDASATGYAAGSIDHSRIPVTVPANPHRALAVFTHMALTCGDPAPPTVSLTFAGVPLTSVHTETNSLCANSTSQIWTLPAGTEPQAGVSELEIVVTPHLGMRSLHAGLVLASGVDPTTTFSAIAGATGLGTLATVDLPPTGPDDLVAYSACSGTNLGDASGVPRWKNVIAPFTSCDNDGGATAPGGTTTLAWGVSNDYWNIVGVAFKSAP